MQRLIGPALAALIVIGASLARDLRDGIWAAYIGYSSTVARQLPVGEAPPQRSRRVVIVLVRGLRAEESQRMPALNALRARGAEITLELGAPTYRIPVWLTLFSGARPATHGTLTDISARNSDIDTIFARLGAAGRASVIIGSADWNDFYGPQVQRIEVVEADSAAQRDSLAMEALLQTLKDPAAPEQLIVVELGLPEEAARRSPDNYAAALAATDIRLQQISSALDLANATLIVTSDRGLTAEGGDGGLEAVVARVPMAMAGAGIRHGTQAIARAEDVAPSLAQLLGVPIPVHAQGAPLWDAIDATAYLASARQLTGFYEGWSEATAQPRFAAELLRTYEADISAGQRARYDTWYIALNAAARQAEQAHAGDGRVQRMPVAIIGLLLILACTLVMLNNSLAPPLLGAAMYSAGWLFDIHVLRASAPSLSLLDGIDPSAYYAWLARDHQILIGVACAATALLAARLCEDSLEAITAVISTVGLVVLACAAQALWFFGQWGDAFAVVPPSPDTIAAVLAALTQAAANDIVISSALPAIPLVLAAPVLAVIAWAALGGGRRIEAL